MTTPAFASIPESSSTLLETVDRSRTDWDWTGGEIGSGGYLDRETSFTMPTTDCCVTGIGATAREHLGATLDLRLDGTETNRVGFQFQLQIPETAATTGGPEGFLLLRWGNGERGTIELKYLPVQGVSERQNPHSLVATVVGDTKRTVTLPVTKTNMFSLIWLEYDGFTLTLVSGRNADQYTSKTPILPVSSPNRLLFGSDVPRVCFRELKIFNTNQLERIGEMPTQFPYFLWDSEESGVIAVIKAGDNVPYHSFYDFGYAPSTQAAEFDLATPKLIKGTTLYINDKAVLSKTYNTPTQPYIAVADLVGKHAVAVDGNWVTAYVTSDGGTKLSVRLGDTKNQHRYSGCAKVCGTGDDGNAILDGSWNATAPILGKIPGQFQHPHTGEPNKAISILGATKRINTPTDLTTEFKDDAVRTAGRVIGSIENRPGSVSTLTRLAPFNFLGSSKAEFPERSMIYGNPNSISDTLPDDSIYAYGIGFERFVGINPPDLGMRSSPANRSRPGDIIAAFSIDIPVGHSLRGLDLCFSAPPPGMKGNYANKPPYCYDWGEGARQFPWMVTGNTDYAVIYYLMVATDQDANNWATIPSLGVDAVKVTGAMTWKEVHFRAIDHLTLKAQDGTPLLTGGRRVHFKMVLAHELGAVTINGMSYKNEPIPKK